MTYSHVHKPAAIDLHVHSNRSDGTYSPRQLVDYAMYDSRYSRDELMKMLDCFQTLIFMEHYKVMEIFHCKGWDEEKRKLIFERIL